MLEKPRARRQLQRSSALAGGLLVALASWSVACSSSDADDGSSGASGGPVAGTSGTSGAFAQAGGPPVGTAGASAGASANGESGASSENGGADVGFGGSTSGASGGLGPAGTGGRSSGGSAGRGGMTSGGTTGAAGGAGAGKGGGASAGGAGGLSTECGQTPVTPNATTTVRKVLCYMRSIYGNHILSGQEENNDDDGMNTVFKATGKYPAIRAFDVNNSRAPTQCTDHWSKGGLCMFGYHMGINGQNFNVAQNITKVLTPDTTENRSFNGNLDRFASYIQPLQDAGGVAIVRLFHEAGNGCHWFWWSDGTSGEWQNLFRYAFDYLTAKKGLKNTIWIAPLCGSPSTDYNPGAKYIDLGGADNYVKAGDYQPLNNIFKQTVAAFPNLMVALHENGSIPDPEQLKSTGTKWLFFNVWSGEFALPPHNPTDHLKAVYSSDYVITRDELPSFK